MRSSANDVDMVDGGTSDDVEAAKLWKVRQGPLQNLVIEIVRELFQDRSRKHSEI